MLEFLIFQLLIYLSVFYNEFPLQNWLLNYSYSGWFNTIQHSFQDSFKHLCHMFSYNAVPLGTSDFLWLGHKVFNYVFDMCCNSVSAPNFVSYDYYMTEIMNVLLVLFVYPKPPQMSIFRFFAALFYFLASLVLNFSKEKQQRPIVSNTMQLEIKTIQ